jgi:hypothetical protein
MVGLDTEKKAWRILLREGGVTCRRDVTFVENDFPLRKKAGNNCSGDLLSQAKAKPTEGHPFNRDPLSDNIPNSDRVEEDVSDNEEKEIEQRRSNRNWKPSSKILTHLASNVSELNQPNPKGFDEAMNCYDKEAWKRAIKSEIQSHIMNGTLEPCDIPPGRKGVPLAWVFCRKLNPDGTLKHKARIVMKGFMQKEGVDFTETFAPVARWTSIRIVLALVNHYDWDINHIDFDTAFMVPKIDAEIYVVVSDGMEDLANKNKTARMLKGVNGCKQGSKLFYDEISNALKKLNFSISKCDSGVFYSWERQNVCIIIMWVDDLLITGSDIQMKNKVIMGLGKKYKFKDHGEPRLFLGLKLKRDRPNKLLTLSHEDYYDELLERFGMMDCNMMPTPAEPGKVYSSQDSPIDEEGKYYMLDKPYRNLACSLLYPSSISRPDTTWAANTACKFLQNPGKEHWTLVQRIVRYIKGTKGLALTYDGKLPMIVTGFPDASWADDLDDRKSTSAYLFFIGSCLISWTCKKQKFVALSTNNAEFIALSDACREGRFIRALLQEIQPAVLPPYTPIYIYEDNEGAMKQANSNILNNANRTIALKFHHVREEIEEGRVKLLHICSQDQIADGLTKSLGPTIFSTLRDRMLGLDKKWWESFLSTLSTSVTPNSLENTDNIPKSSQEKHPQKSGKLQDSSCPQASTTSTSSGTIGR